MIAIRAMSRIQHISRANLTISIPTSSIIAPTIASGKEVKCWAIDSANNNPRCVSIVPMAIPDIYTIEGDQLCAMAIIANAFICSKCMGSF